MGDHSQQLASIRSAIQAAADQRAVGGLTPEAEESAARAIRQFQNLLRTVPEIAGAFMATAQRIDGLIGTNSEFVTLRDRVVPLVESPWKFLPACLTWRRKDAVLRLLTSDDAFRDNPSAYIRDMAGFWNDLRQFGVDESDAAGECVGRFVTECQRITDLREECEPGFIALPFLANLDGTCDPVDDVSYAVGNLSAGVLSAMAESVKLVEDATQREPSLQENPTINADSGRSTGHHANTAALIAGEGSAPALPDKKPRKKTIGERMAEMINDDRSTWAWCSAPWARHLECEDSSIRKTVAWKSLEPYRESLKQSSAIIRNGRNERVKH